MAHLKQLAVRLESNVRRSIEFLENKNSQEAETGKPTEEPKPWGYYWFPSFVPTNGKLECPQSRFFGFFAMAKILTNQLASYRFIQAGNFLRKRGFLAMSVVSHYCGINILMESFMAGHGRVIIRPALGAPKTVVERVPEKPAPPGSIISRTPAYQRTSTKRHVLFPQGQAAVVARLSKTNTWTFAKLNQGHASQWREVKNLLAHNDPMVPQPFGQFFAYLVPNTESITAQSLIAKAIDQLQEVRHRAVYDGFGFDPKAYTSGLNHDAIGAQGISRRAEWYEWFALSLLSQEIERTMSIKNRMDTSLSSTIQRDLFMFTMSTHYEPPELAPPLPQSILTKMRDNYAWFYGTTSVFENSPTASRE